MARNHTKDHLKKHHQLEYGADDGYLPNQTWANIDTLTPEQSQAVNAVDAVATTILKHFGYDPEKDSLIEAISDESRTIVSSLMSAALPFTRRATKSTMETLSSDSLSIIVACASPMGVPDLRLLQDLAGALAAASTRVSLHDKKRFPTPDEAMREVLPMALSALQ